MGDVGVAAKRMEGLLLHSAATVKKIVKLIEIKSALLTNQEIRMLNSMNFSVLFRKVKALDLDLDLGHISFCDQKYPLLYC